MIAVRTELRVGVVSTTPTEPREAIIRPAPHADVTEHFRAIAADMRDRGVQITRLGVLSRALDVGVPEVVAVDIAAQVDKVGS